MLLPPKFNEPLFRYQLCRFCGSAVASYLWMKPCIALSPCCCPLSSMNPCLGILAVKMLWRCCCPLIFSCKDVLNETLYCSAPVLLPLKLNEPLFRHQLWRCCGGAVAWRFSVLAPAGRRRTGLITWLYTIYTLYTTSQSGKLSTSNANIQWTMYS